MSLVVDVCAAGLADAATAYMYCRTLSSPTPSQHASKPPELNELLTPPQRKAYPFLEQDNPEQVRREAQRQAAFEVVMRWRQRC
jgi:hypothetical protein